MKWKKSPLLTPKNYLEYNFLLTLLNSYFKIRYVKRKFENIRFKK